MNTEISESRMRTIQLIHGRDDYSRPNIDMIHVSDLVSPCLRQRYWQKFDTPEPANASMLIGTVIHKLLETRGCRLYPNDEHEVTLRYDVLCDKPWDGTAECKQHTVVGTVDCVARINGRNIMIDYKTTAKVPQTPKSQHMTQILCYKRMWEAIKREPINHMVIMYIDPDLTPVAYEVPNQSIVEYMRHCVVEWSSATKSKPPHRPVNPPSWLCAKCPYIGDCIKLGL